ncbi:MAG: FtsW/RodA/SpoVE family cell cycle protein [Anaerolineaceae bacterium]|nr:FtsW/RodA/SpoVE family cell cycle protein [Anaerolineaceae bacterium]
MGESNFVNKNSGSYPIAKRTQGFVKFDVILVIIVIALVTLGLVMVYSSSWYFSILAENNTSYAVTRQALLLIFGIVSAVVVSQIDYHKYQNLALLILFASGVMLVAVLFTTPNEFGAKRTLFGGSVQPSELAKLATVIYLSVWLYSKRENLNNIFFGLVPLAVIIAVVASLILSEPDLSAALTIVVLGGILFYMANAELRQIIIVILLILLAGFVVINLYSNGKSRIIEYWNGLQDPTSASDHMKFSIRAIVEGGLFGKGLGKGSIKILGLPVAWTDSIFAVIAEELGLVGAGAVLFMYMIFMWRGLKIAQKAPDELGKILAGGLTLWITWEAVINMGVMVNVFPFAGNALPLISTGGSNLVTVLIAIGILLNISRAGNTEAANQTRRSPGAFNRVRRRNGRRRVSSAHRPTNAG